MKISKITKSINIKSQLIQYFRQRNIFTAFSSIIVNGTSQTALEIVRLSVYNKLKKRLTKKYRYVFNSEKSSIKRLSTPPENPVWIAWFDGVDKAPDVVKKCYASALKNLDKFSVILITKENLEDYIQLPDFIVEKYKNGIISQTHFSDILRLELLATYGGTWIDSTIYFSNNVFPESWFYSDIFFFQNLKPGKNGDAIPVSSWFIHSIPEHEIIMNTREMLFEYWKNTDYLLDYFIMHQFLRISQERFEKKDKLIARFSNATPHIFLLEWDRKYDEKRYKEIMEVSPIHKLTYKKLPEQADSAFSFWFQNN